MSVRGYICAGSGDPAARERRSAARPLGVVFVVILRVAILALGLEFRGCRPLAQRAAPRPRANVLARDLRPMIRPVLTEIALFLAPFLIYAVFLWATQALVLMIGSFVVLAQWGGSPPGSTYVPAHVEDGQFVPGETK